MQMKLSRLTEPWPFVSHVKLSTAFAKNSPKPADHALVVHAEILHFAIETWPANARSEKADLVMGYELLNSRFFTDDMPRLAARRLLI